MNKEPLVTFGIVNCNRLHYLKSCLESLLYCTEDYKNKEIIIVDNASVEEGTSEYLDELENRGYRVFRNETRDPANEFAMALNKIFEESKGEFICPLQGDSQFVIRGNWLHEYVKFYSQNHENVACIMLDAQRTIRNNSDTFSNTMGEEFKFAYSFKRKPICGAADVMYSREILQNIYPWNVSNSSHEGGGDSETKMLRKVERTFANRKPNFFCTVPVLPVSLAIYTDPRGTNARVRGNKRYGSYWPPLMDYRYYKIYDMSDTKKIFKHSSNHDENIPLGIEKIASPIGWEKPLDLHGNWLKNPIDPDTASSSEYTVLYDGLPPVIVSDEDYLDDWLSS